MSKKFFLYCPSGRSMTLMDGSTAQRMVKNYLVVGNDITGKKSIEGRSMLEGRPKNLFRMDEDSIEYFSEMLLSLMKKQFPDQDVSMSNVFVGVEE